MYLILIGRAEHVNKKVCEYDQSQGQRSRSGSVCSRWHKQTKNGKLCSFVFKHVYGNKEITYTCVVAQRLSVVGEFILLFFGGELW